jgi:uncharacterized protein YkwD
MKALAALVPLLLFAPSIADAAPDDVVNAIRKRGCDGKTGIARPLRESRALDAVAREWSKGGRLKDAFARTDYRMVNSASMRVTGGADEKQSRGGGVWVVLAQPFTAPTTKDAASVSREVLRLVNAARAAPRKCGRKTFQPAPPLALAPLLERAARTHAQDMAQHSLFEHRGSDGSKPSERVTRAGYRWRTVAENIAAGARDAQTVVQGWLDSPGHCVNIMGAQYSEMGVAYAVDPKSEAGVYWAQVFASPR